MKTKYDFHITPDYIVDLMIKKISINSINVLEPYAGSGVFLTKLRDYKLFYYEKDEDRVSELTTNYDGFLGFDYNYYTCLDNYFDCIITNPPFSQLSHSFEIFEKSLKLNGTAIILVPTHFKLDHSFFKIIEEIDLGEVDFTTSKVNCKIIVAQKIDTNSIEPKLNVIPTTDKGKYLEREMFFYLQMKIINIYKADFLLTTPLAYEKDLVEWRVEINFFGKPYFGSNWEEQDSTYSVFFKKGFIPTIDDILYESFLNFKRYFDIFNTCLLESNEFLCETDEHIYDQWVYLWYGLENVSIKELRLLSYRLYKEFKFLNLIFLDRNSVNIYNTLCKIEENLNYI